MPASFSARIPSSHRRRVSRPQHPAVGGYRQPGCDPMLRRRTKLGRTGTQIDRKTRGKAIARQPDRQLASRSASGSPGGGLTQSKRIDYELCQTAEAGAGHCTGCCAFGPGDAIASAAEEHLLGISGVEVFGDGCKSPIDDPEDAGIVTVVTAAVTGPGVGGPLSDGILAVSDPEAGRLPRRIQVASGAKVARTASMSPARRARKKSATTARLASVEASCMSFSCCVLLVSR